MGLLLDDGTPTIFGDGSQTRDYVYVHDVARAMLLALDRAAGGVFNVGTGTETSVLELYAAIQEASGVRRTPKLAPARLGELQRSVLDTSLAARELGWRSERPCATASPQTWSWAETR